MSVNFPSLSIAGLTGTTVAAANGTATITIPLTASGLQPKWIYVAYYTALTSSNRLMVGPGSTIPGTTKGVMLGYYQDSSYVILNVTGYTEFSYREAGASTTSFTIYPLEDG